MKAKTISEAKQFTDIPNVGPRIAHDFKTLGIQKPMDLKGQNPLKLYLKLCEKTKVRHDPCVLDTFMAVVDFANGNPARHWFTYTNERKRKYTV